MSIHHRFAITRTLALVGLAAGVIACAPHTGNHLGEGVPESGSRHHMGNYIIQASIEPGEMEEKTLPDHRVAKGDPPLDPPRHVWADPTMDSTPTSLEIDDSLAEACKIPHAGAFFTTDSSDLQDEAKAALDALAECFVSGAMKGHRLAITGHADPRGTEKYNKQLGLDRAQSVSDYLEQAGLRAQEMAVDSEGEAKAHQDNPEMWPTDRKVVLDVAIQEDSAAAEDTAAE